MQFLAENIKKPTRLKRFPVRGFARSSSVNDREKLDYPHRKNDGTQQT
jgi:hypothetical protein